MQKRKDTQIRQKEIILAARKLIVKYGSEHVTIRKIAQEIGITEAAIYKHFKSKRDVLSLLVDDIENTLISDIDNSFTRDISSLEILEKIIAEHVSTIEQRRGVTFLVIAEIISLGDKKLNKKIHRVIDKYIGRIESILAEGVNTGIIRPDLDLNAASYMFFSMIQGLVNIWALSHYEFDLISKYKSTWKIFLKSIAQSEASNKSCISA